MYTAMKIIQGVRGRLMPTFRPMKVMMMMPMTPMTVAGPTLAPLR